MVRCTALSILCPAGERQIYADTAQSIAETQMFLQAQGIPSRFKWISCSDIEDLRNLMVTLFYYLQKEASHVLFVDKDMHFSPALVWDMLKFDKPVTGCYYSRREFPPSVVGRSLTEEDHIENVVDGFQKVEGVGGGVLLIRRSAIKDIITKFPDLIDKSMKHPVAGQLKAYNLTNLLTIFAKMTVPEIGRLSEDLSFCNRWRQCGGDVWANIRHPIGHIGPYEWAIKYEDYLIGKKQEQDKAKEAENKAA